MSGETERGTRFARDLRRIRRERGVSLADIHDATKMAYDMIKRFEHDALINHPHFSKVYLRLFVRGYAEHLDMDVEMTLEALELAIQGRYTGSLAQEYLGEPEEEPRQASPKRAKKTGRKEESAASESDQETEATPPTQSKRKPAKTPQEKSAGRTRRSGPAASRPKATEPKAADPGATASGAPKSEATDSGTPPTEQPAARKTSSAKPSAVTKTSSLKAPADRSASARASSSGASPSKGADAKAPAGSDSGSGTDPRWIFLGVLVVVVGLGIWGLTRVGSGPDGFAQEASLSAELGGPAGDAAVPENNIPMQSLPDTLNVTIVADKGSVAPIRVTVDNDLRRPYWISRGSSMTFRVADRIILEQQLDSVTVQVEGMAYPVSRPTGEDMATLTRAALDSWFSSIQP